MKNPTTFITKNGVSDADLIRAAREMYEALQEISDLIRAAREMYEALQEISDLPSYREDEGRAIATSALAKARGVRS